MLKRLRAYLIPLVDCVGRAGRFPGLAIVMMTVWLFSPLQAIAGEKSGFEVLDPIRGGTYSGALGISGDGTVIVGWTDEKRSTRTRVEKPVWRDGSTVGFIWTKDGGMTSLGSLVDGIYSWEDTDRLPWGWHAPGYGASVATATSYDGTVVVGRSVQYLYSKPKLHIWHPFVWTKDGGMVDLGTLGGDGIVGDDGSAGGAHGVSDDGKVVTGWAADKNRHGHAFRWTKDSGMVDLGTLGGDWSHGWAVSANGDAIAGWSDVDKNDGGRHAFRWVKGRGMTDLGTAGGKDSEGHDISADGEVVVGWSDVKGDGRNAFRWTRTDGMVALGTLGGRNSEANGVSANGSVVVGSSDTADGKKRAFRWTADGGMQSIEDWLREAGVEVSDGFRTEVAKDTDAGGNVVVGMLEDGRAFIARVDGPVHVSPENKRSSSALADSGLTEFTSLSTAYGISARGDVVVGGADTAGGRHAFSWTKDGGLRDLGTLSGYDEAQAHGVSTRGDVIVGAAQKADGQTRAFRWTRTVGMVSMGTLGGPSSSALATSSLGDVVVGWADIVAGEEDDPESGDGGGRHAFRWTKDGGMLDLGTLGGRTSQARGVSGDGAVVVGWADVTPRKEIGNGYTVNYYNNHAFRWTQDDGMVDLGTLGGGNSQAYGVSAYGDVVVGRADTAGGSYHAFRWTQDDGMLDLGTLSGFQQSVAYGVSAGGNVVVGAAVDGEGRAGRAFRWNDINGMQSVEDWLSDSGVAVGGDIKTKVAYGTNAGGNVVVGQLQNGKAFIARAGRNSKSNKPTDDKPTDDKPTDGGNGRGSGWPWGGRSGLVTTDELQSSLADSGQKSGDVRRVSDMTLNGAHSRPLQRRVAPGRSRFWTAGDWGRDDHGDRSGQVGLMEIGVGRHFGPAQLNLALGRTWARQDFVFNGKSRLNSRYLLLEALVPLRGSLWATVGAYGNWGDVRLHRGYLNAGNQDYSSARPDVATYGLRARLDWLGVWQLSGTRLSPYVDLTRSRGRIDAYTETGGGFPITVGKRTEHATELRLGVDTARQLTDLVRFTGKIEVAHHFEKRGARMAGQVLGLSGFSFKGQANQRNWLRAGVGIDGKLVGGEASATLYMTTRGQAPSAWIAVNWQRTF